MRILVINDDGIHAQGLKVLEGIARTLSSDVWVVCPETEQSATSHSLTLTRPLRIRYLGEQRYSINGTPTDCALLGAHQILGSHPPDLVLSGVNHGHNMAEDINYSGTVAAASEATLLGFRAIALSLSYREGIPFYWETPQHFGPEIIQKLLSFSWDKDVLMNVNFPSIPWPVVQGIRVTTQGRRIFDNRITPYQDPNGADYSWIGTTYLNQEYPLDTDLAALEQNYISITPLQLDRMHGASLASLRDVFET